MKTNETRKIKEIASIQMLERQYHHTASHVFLIAFFTGEQHMKCIVVVELT